MPEGRYGNISLAYEYWEDKAASLLIVPWEMHLPEIFHRF